MPRKPQISDLDEKRITVRVPGPLVAKLERLAAANYSTPSEEIRRMILGARIPAERDERRAA